MAASLEDSWWLHLKGQPCHVGFASHPGLNVRAGSLTDGAIVKWRNFSKNKAVARLFKRKDPVVTPIAFGFTKKGGPPLAAQIEFDHAGKRVKGVMALRINGRYLKLVPLE